MAKLRILPLVILLVLSFGVARSQQDAQFSMFMFNQMYFNPAYAGDGGVTRFQLQNRWQWAGYQPTFDDGGAPSTLIASASVPLAPIKGSLGLHYVNDHLGPAGNQEVQLSYAYRMNINDNTLSIGARVGLYNRFVDFGQLRARDAGDPLIPTGRLSQTQPDVTLGVLYDTEIFYVGLSLNHLNRAKFPFGSAQATNSLSSNAYLMGGYRWYPSDVLEVQPMVLLKSEMNFNPKTMSFEGGVLGTYNDTFFVGATYRWQDAGALIAGVNLFESRFRVGYSADFTVAGVEAKSPTSHEVHLSYTLPAPRFGKKSIVRTPRFRY